MNTNNKMVITLSSMKSKIFSVILFVFLGIYSVQGQGNILEAIQNSVNEMEETNPGRDSARGRTPHNNNNEPSGQQNDALKKLKLLFGENIAAFDEKMDRYFPTEETRCIFIMINYLYEYFRLLHKIEETHDCKKKSDLLAMQASAIAASTFIMYCPENLSNMTVEELEIIYVNDLDPTLKSNDPAIRDWINKYGVVVSFMNLLMSDRTNSGGRGHWRGGDLLDLCYYFSPKYILPTSIWIQRKIGDLRACGGTN